MNRTVLLLGVALLLSLGLNALQWTNQSEPPSAGSEGSAADSVVVSATNDAPEETECWVELAQCRGDLREALNAEPEEEAQSEAPTEAPSAP